MPNTYACPMTPGTAPTSSSCTSIGGITSVTIAGVTLNVWPEKSHAESVYSFNKDTGAGYWTTSVYVWFISASKENRDFINSLRGQGDVSLVTAEGNTWTVDGVYMTAGNIQTGTKAEDGASCDATFSCVSKDAPVIAVS